MTQEVSPATVLGNFSGDAISAFGETYRHIKEGDQYFVEMRDPWPTSNEDPQRVRRELVMSTGSHHMQVYWYELGSHRTLIQSPMAFLRREQRWVPVQSTFLKPPLASMSHVVGGWNQSCNMCHATGARPGLQNPPVVDTQVSEFGIACEACHGPGEQHILAHRSSSSDPVTDEHIFNPATADPRASSQACGQCHGIWVARTPEDFENWKREGFEYRPGRDLDQHRYVLTGKASEDVNHSRDKSIASAEFYRDRFWSDGMVRLAGREYNGLIRSPCYQHGNPNRDVLQCISCHQMHPPSADDNAPSDWANDQLARDKLGNAACLQCHSEYRDKLEQHTHHQRSSEGSQCMNCHMPHTTYGLYKAIRSHQVSSPSIQESLSTGRPNACNQCHLDKTFAWAADELQAKFGVPRPNNMKELHSRYAVAPLWTLGGDAGQRALVAWSMGWQPAQEASGTEWMVPYLAQLLTDPYDAVRMIAHRSLCTIPTYESFAFDFLAPAATRQQRAKEVLSRWESQHEGRNRTGPEILIETDGGLRKRIWAQMYKARDNRPISLEE